METVVAFGSGLFFVWGGQPDSFVPLSDGGIYNAALDSWSPMASQGAPAPRFNAFGFATASEIVVWGGVGGPNSNNLVPLANGGAYNPTTNTWKALSDVGAPTPRVGPAIVAAGNDMLVWGGGDKAGNLFGDGAIYHSDTDTWEVMESAGAPSARLPETYLWMDHELLIFGGAGCGGRDSSGSLIPCNDSGFTYDPAKRRWRAIATGLAPRSAPSAAWTGSRAFIWGGTGACCTGENCTCNSGGLYDPLSDAWQAVETRGAPSSGRAYWIGDSVLIVTGTYLGASDPGRYFPP